jgi:MFS family permease
LALASRTEIVVAMHDATAPARLVLDSQWTRETLQRRVLTVVVISQIFGGAGLAAGITVGALLARDMLGSTSFSGLPVALLTGGSAAAALLIGRASQRWGRRPGLVAGYAAGAAGGAGITAAAAFDSVPLLLVSFVVFGSGTATNLQARYAGADLADATSRGRAVSTILVATTAGAVAGPNLVSITGNIAASAGLPRLAGPFALATLAFAVAAAILFVFLRPDPLLAAATLDARAAAPTTADAAMPTSASAYDLGSATLRTVRIAATAMVLTQLAMVAIMTMTPVHLSHHGHGLSAIGFVIGVHIAGMYLPSPLTGWMADRYGRRFVLVGAGAVLLASGLVAALAPPDSVFLLALALALLGLGWNLGLVGGTALVADATTSGNRARTQGAVDLTIALAGATGGLVSGSVVAASSYALLAVAGGILGLLILPAALVASAKPAPAVT